MKINKSVTYSSIVGIGEKIKKVEKETGVKFLTTQRGIPDVCNIDLSNIINKIDFNSKEAQQYTPNLGILSFRKNIGKLYFPYIENIESNICITCGGMKSIDLSLQILNMEKVYFPYLYWSSYSKMATIRVKKFDFYKSLSDFDLSELDENSVIFVNYPSNPTGQSIDNLYLLNMIKKITDTGAIIIFDSPYYRLFNNDNFFEEVLQAGKNNIIICESFSKCYGLSGLRLGFICSLNNEFNEELNIRILYEFNGVSSASQFIVDKLISTEEGKISIKEFQEETVEHITKNINYLKHNGLLAEEIYGDEIPIGIFSIINKSESYLFENKIGAVGLEKFCNFNKEHNKKYSRICVSIRHKLFKEFIKNII